MRALESLRLIGLLHNSMLIKFFLIIKLAHGIFCYMQVYSRDISGESRALREGLDRVGR